MESDLLEIMLAVEEERLSQIDIKFKQGASCCVIMASDGYPQSYQTGYPIIDNSPQEAIVYHAGTKLVDGQVVTAGGRVLGVTAIADDLPTAIDKAYQAVGQISFANAYYRHDIGQRALAALQNK